MSDAAVAERPTRVESGPRANGAIDATHITGLDTVETGDSERMLILMDIEQLMASADMGLSDSLLH